jgi:alkanesulfonate monooxygenase SsuD/methylene tetrahydromethanopterin reductase-like flavin-dependent oxidoreductase (luciferase family)
MAVRYADEWNTTARLEDAQHKSHQLDALCREHGRDPATLHRSKLISLHLLDSRAEAEKIPDQEAQSRALIGDAESIVEQVNRWAAIGVDHLHFYTPRPMNRPMLERFARDVMPRFA